MTRQKKHALALASILGVFAASPVHAASVTKVNSWGASGVPSYLTMYIYVPDKVATNPPILVGCHSCGTPVDGYKNSIKKILAAADANGFIVILPEATGRNCWDVGTTKSLTHDGGGDTQGVAQMVKYALSQYQGDASRVYIMGGSSGAMMTQAMIAVYPEVFKAGSARAGVPAGCWADGFDGGQQWSNNCAGGRTSKTAKEWGDLVRGMNPGYTGPRRRIQLFHGTSDQTINYNNMKEAIKEWTNVLDLPETPTSSDTSKTSIGDYDRQFWKNACGSTVLEAWSAKGGGHSMNYEEESILAFFGLDKAGGTDPECTGSAPPGGGAGGGGGGGGGSGTLGTGGALSSGGGGTTGAGASGVGGTTQAGGAPAAAGAGSGGTPPTTPATGGAMATTGGSSGGTPPVVAPPSGGSGDNAGGSGAPPGGTPGAPIGAPTDTASDDGGCSVAPGRSNSSGAYSALGTLGLALIGLHRRRGRRS
jgi:poly(hydroxyalkanoate) depolymerase family esterase